MMNRLILEKVNSSVRCYFVYSNFFCFGSGSCLFCVSVIEVCVEETNHFLHFKKFVELLFLL